MKNNYISIPKTNTSKINQRFKTNAINYSNNKSSNNLNSLYIQTDLHSKIVPISFDNGNKLNKNINANPSILLKRGQMNPSTYNQDLHSQYYEFLSSRINMENEPRENTNPRPYLNNKNFFNDNQNHFSYKKINNSYNDNSNNIEKSRENYSYYESKYSKNSYKDRDEDNNKNLYNNKFTYNNNTILYSNENKNTMNLNSKNIATKIIKRTNLNELSNSNIKNSNGNTIEKITTIVNSSENRNKKRIIINNSISVNKTTRINKANMNKNQNNMNKYNFPHSTSINLENDNYRYQSPKKPQKDDKNLLEYHNNSYVSKDVKLEKFSTSKSFDRIAVKKIDFTQQKDESNNAHKRRRIEMIKEYQSNIIEVKKPVNMALRKIPISPKGKNLNNNSYFNSSSKKFQNVNKNLTSTKPINKIKSIHSYTTTKLEESQPQINRNLNKKSFIKGINLLDYKFKKSQLYENDYALNNKKIIEKDNNLNNTYNTIQVTSHKILNEGTNKKRVNGAHNNNSDEMKYAHDKNHEMNSQKNILINNKLNKDKIEIIHNDKSEKRIPSQYRTIINKRNSEEEIKIENIVLKQNTKPIINKVNEHNFNEIVPNKNFTDKKYSEKNKLNKNNSLMNKNLSNNKNSIDITSNNFIHTIQTSKENSSHPQYLDNNSSYFSKHNSKNKFNDNSTNNQKQKSRRLSDFSKYESRPSMQVYNSNMKNDENDNEEEWDHAQYMGIRKTTYDPGLRQRKKKNKNLVNLLKNTFLNSEFSQNTYIKSCESITVPGKKENGNKKVNQDSYIIERNINGILNFNIFGVLDGHGEYGHYASQFVSRYVISHIKNHPVIKKCDEPKEIYQKLTLNGYQIIANIFTDADVQIQKEKFDVQNSGTTCIIVIQLEEKIICANTGDSRAIMIYDTNYSDNLINTKIYNLSYDCKPELPNECQRIYECGGCVERAVDENEHEGGPYRVWVYGEDYPGLAMSRSIGDLDAKKIGVIPNPQIVEYTLDSNSKYMLIASDGIWEFITNEEAMRIGNKFYLRNDATGLCNELYRESVNYWLKEDCIIDDITLIVVFF